MNDILIKTYFIARNESVTQGHHHNGDQATQRPHILCSICIHSFGALEKAVRLFVHGFTSSQPTNVFSNVPKKAFLANLQPSSYNLKMGLFGPIVQGFVGHRGLRKAPSTARLWGPMFIRHPVRDSYISRTI